MAKPLDLDVIRAEFSEDDVAWVLRDEESGKYVTIPHVNYPGRNIFHFFLSELDAERMLDLLIVESPALRSKHILPHEVRLKQALRGIAGSGNPADGFVVTQNKVFEFLWKGDGVS